MSYNEGGVIASHDPADGVGPAAPVASSNGKYFHSKNIEISSVSVIRVHHFLCIIHPAHTSEEKSYMHICRSTMLTSGSEHTLGHMQPFLTRAFKYKECMLLLSISINTKRYLLFNLALPLLQAVWLCMNGLQDTIFVFIYLVKHRTTPGLVATYT